MTLQFELPSWAVIIWMTLCLLNFAALFYFLMESILRFLKPRSAPVFTSKLCHRDPKSAHIWNLSAEGYRFCAGCRKLERRSTLIPWRWKLINPPSVINAECYSPVKPIRHA